MLREFLYVDVTRARSLLAQLDEGVVESVVGVSGRRTTWDVGAGIGAIKGARTAEKDASTQQSKSLEDLLFVIFEDIAESLGLIRSVDPSEIEDPSRWDTSAVHGEFEEGELIRVFTPVMIVDPLFLAARFAKFLEMSAKLNALNVANVTNELAALRPAFDAETDSLVAAQVTSGPREQRKAQERRIRKEREDVFAGAVAAVEAQFSQVDAPGLAEVFEFMETYLAVDSIYVRFLACGIDHPEFAFVGSLLSRDDYIQRERETLYSRYGARLEGWTSILQIARIGTKAEFEEFRDRSFDNLDLVGEDSGIKRPALLVAAAQIEEKMEGIGIVEGPMWPGISVVPLAIYRTVPRSASLPVFHAQVSEDRGNPLQPSGEPDRFTNDPT